MDATDYKDVSKPVKRKQSEEHLEESRPAKQGRPSKLSPSQKRKFARLYLYTNVSLDDICRIIGLTQVVVKFVSAIRSLGRCSSIAQEAYTSEHSSRISVRRL